jgi:hypothetical protein
MARPAGQLEETSLIARNGALRGANRVSLTRKIQGGTPNVKQALAWIADTAGAGTLASQINSLGSTETWDTTYHYSMSLKTDRDGNVLCRVMVQDASGFDVDNEREYDFSRSGLKEALAQVAGDWGASTLQSQLLGL